MRIVIFGTGTYYTRNKDRMPPDTKIVAFIDNNSALWGTYIDGTKVYAPNDIKTLTYDAVILSSARAYEMKSQMIDLGIEEDKLLHWGELCRLGAPDAYSVYKGKHVTGKLKKKILIISTDLNYNGGTMAAVYAARALQMGDFSVTLAAPWGNRRLIDEIVSEGITVVIYPVLPYIYAKEVGNSIDEFDVVIVNVFQMIQCACEISRKKPVLWWIHENSSKYTKEYPNTQTIFTFYNNLEQMKKINIMGVSRIACSNFNYYYPNGMRKILPYGIPDMEGYTCCVDKKKKMIFAIIGVIDLRKAQQIFVEAIKQLSMSEREHAEFWIIGKPGQSIYYQQVLANAEEVSQIKFLGEMTREEIHLAYQEIDVVVCASLEETMSLAITEGMMYEKICITTETTGMAEYINDGENGFVCKADNASDLKNKMSFVIRNKENMSNIKKNARKTYEKYFTLEAFGERLESAIEDTKREYCNVGV